MTVIIRILDKKTLVIKERACPEKELGKCGVYGQLRYLLRSTPILNDRDYEIFITHEQEESK